MNTNAENVPGEGGMRTPSDPPHAQSGAGKWPGLLTAAMPLVVYEILRAVLFADIPRTEIHLITFSLLALPLLIGVYQLLLTGASVHHRAANPSPTDIDTAVTGNFMMEGADLLNGLIQASPVAIAVADRNHRLRLTNPAFRTIFGYTLRECVGKRVRELIVPDEEKGGFDDNAQTVVSGKIVLGVLKRKRKDGGIVYVEAYIIPVYANGVRDGTVAVYQDISKRLEAEDALRHSEEVFRTLSEASPIGIFRTDLNGKILYVNERLTEIIGISEEQVYAQGWHAAVHPEDWDRFHGLWRKAVQDGSSFSDQHRLVKANKQIVWVGVHGKAVRNGNGQLQGYVGAVEDITALRIANDRMREAKDTAEAASKSKGEFLANMSHEIRTPLNGILGMAELALDTQLNTEQRDFLETLRLSADSLLTVVNDILDFSKIEAGKLDLESIDFNLRDSMEAAIKTLAFRAEAKGLELLCEIAPDVPEVLRGDPTRIRQVVLNLVGNAIKFTAKGEIALKVDCAPSAEDFPLLHFSVADTGIGIPAEKQKAIFDPFSQADTSTTRKYGGTGLGLTICASLVEMMGGKIWVESELHKGTRFHFTVKMEPAKGKAPAPLPARIDTLPAIHVLIVDDNHTNRRILLETLTRWGMRAHAVEGGDEAIAEMTQAIAAKDPYQLLLTDLLMPKMDGFGLIESIRKDPALRAPTIMMLTSAGHHGDSERCQQLGISAYLMKPIRQLELREAIMRALQSGTETVRPVAVEQNSDHFATNSFQPNLPTPNGTGSAISLHVLLAEDNLVNQKLATRLLEKRGHLVKVVGNGREAVEATAKENFDLVLMDVQMPEMDGFEAVGLIRAREKTHGGHQPIVAVTAHAMKGDRERCLEAGMDFYLTKPIHSAELDALLARFANKPATPAPTLPEQARAFHA